MADQNLEVVEMLEFLVTPTEIVWRIFFDLFLHVLHFLQDLTLIMILNLMHISMKVVSAALTEVSIQLIIICATKWETVFLKNDTVVLRVSQINMASQTSGPWQKKIRSKERVYFELLELLRNKTSALKRKRRLLLRKGKLKVNHFEKELAGKQKLLSGVCLRLANIGIHVDHLTHRIREKRVQLEKCRQQNKQVVERYEELNQQLNSYLNTVLIDQAPDVQLEIPSG